MKKLFGTMIAAATLMAAGSAVAPAQKMSVLEGLPVVTNAKVDTQRALAQINDCCGDPIPECPPICPPPDGGGD